MTGGDLMVQKSNTIVPNILESFSDFNESNLK